MKRTHLHLLFIAVLLVSFSRAQDFAANTTQPILDVTKKKAIMENIANIPVSFRKNAGQWDDKIVYRGFSPGWNANVNFLKDGLSFGVKRKIAEEKKETTTEHHTFSEVKPIDLLIWNLCFKGMNANVSIVGEGQQDSHVNYLLGNDVSKHQVNVPDYKIVNYNNVYDNIDVKYYSTGKNIKYDFILKPGADANKIQMDWQGIKSLSVNKNKQLEITNEWGTLIEEMPESYQIINGKKVLVAVEYVALSKTTFGFKIVGAYDKSQTLIIDPVILAWGTFVGAVGTDEGYCHDVAVDAAGNVYCTGFYEGNFPITPGAYGHYISQQDVFVFKMKPDGTSLIYATYLGGSGIEWGYGVAANAAGEVFVTGWTGSANFPVTAGAYQTALSGMYSDVFVTKLNATGTAAIYSTYIGNQYGDEGRDIAINAAGEAFITGLGNASYPVTAAGIHPNGTYGGAIITKLNASGTALIYSGMLGGSMGACGYAIAIDAAGEAFVTGETGSWVNTPPNYTDFPVTPGAFMTNFGNCGWKAFVTKVNTAGSGIVYSSLLGGSGNCPQNGADVGRGIAVNSAGEAFVVGNTSSSNFPTTTGAYDRTYGGSSGYMGGDGFLTRFNASGTGVIYSTYFGGTGGEEICAVAVNSADEAFISGYTDTDDGTFPITSCAYQSAFGGASTASSGRGDMFLAKFNTTGSTVLYSTFMGGNSDDYKYPHVALFGPCEEEVIVNGTSHSSNFPTTAGSFMPAKGNGGDDQPVVFKLKPKVNPMFTFTNPNCNLTVNFKDTTTGNCIWQAGPWTPSTWHWDFGDGTTSTQQNPVHTYAASGTYQVKLIVTCPKDSITLPVTVSLTGGNASIAPVPPICLGSSAVLVASGGSGYSWSANAGSATTASVTVTPTVTTTYSVTTTGTCPGTATVSVVVSPSPTVTIGSNSPVCLGQSLNFTSGGGGSGATYSWSGPNSFTAAVQNPVIAAATLAASGVYTVTVTNSGGCVASSTIAVTVSPLVNVVYKADTACMGTNTTFTDLTANVPVGTIYNWSFGDGTSSASVGTATHIYPHAGVYTSTLSIGNSSGCINTGTLVVVVKSLPLVNHVPSPSYCPSQLTTAIPFTSTPGGSASSFYWTNLNTSIGLSAGGSGSLPAFTTVNSTGVSVTAVVLVHASFNGCTGPDSSFSITISPSPIADFISQNKICQGSSIQFTDHSSGSIAQWNWDLNNDGNFSDAVTQNASYTFTTPGTHTVGLIVSINQACKDTIEKTVYINPLPVPSFVGDNLAGCPILNVNFTDHSTIAAPSHITSWSWNFGNGGIFVGQFPGGVSYGNNSQTLSATYSVSLTVVSDSGCSASLVKPNYITVYPRPHADFSYETDLTGGDGIDPTVNFYNQSIGASSVHWYLGDVFAHPASTNYSNLNNPTHTYLHEEGYTYYITEWAINSFGCADSITKPIEVKPGFTFYIPNAFSPNGDDVNDGFKGTGVGIDNATYNLLIFDRWGNLIWKATDLEKAWNGRINGKDEVVQEDVYVWKASFNDFSGKKHEYKGTVSLIK